MPWVRSVVALEKPTAQTPCRGYALATRMPLLIEEGTKGWCGQAASRWKSRNPALRDCATSGIRRPQESISAPPGRSCPCNAGVPTGDLLLSAMRSRLGDPLQSMRAAPGRRYENVVFGSQIRRGERGTCLPLSLADLRSRLPAAGGPTDRIMGHLGIGRLYFRVRDGNGVTPSHEAGQGHVCAPTRGPLPYAWMIASNSPVAAGGSAPKQPPGTRRLPPQQRWSPTP